MRRNSEVLQKRVRILEMGTAAITGVYARGLFFEKRLDSPRAGRVPLRRAKRGTSPVRRGGMPPPSVGFADSSPGGGGGIFVLW